MTRRWRFIAGDPLRGLAALGVLVLHSGNAALGNTGYGAAFPGPSGRLDAFGDVVGSAQLAGFFGVWIFFVLSGYLIGRPFVRAVITRSRGPSILRYARNRALRILPPYWVVLTIALAFGAWSQRASASLSQCVEYYLLLLPEGDPLSAWLAHAWTLEVEMKFYVAIPFVALAGAFALRRLVSADARASAIATAALTWACVTPFLTGDLLGNSFLELSRLFMLGIAIAALEPIAAPRLAGRRRWRRASMVAFALAGAYVLAFPWMRFGIGGALEGVLPWLALDLAIACIVAAPLVSQWVDGRCWRALDNPATRWLGSRSYSFYLVHYGIVVELSLLLARAGYGYKVTFALLVPTAVVATSVCAEILYRAVERPFLRRKRRAISSDVGAPSAGELPRPLAQLR